MEERIWIREILRLTAVYEESDKFLEREEGFRKLLQQRE
jgi:hypothetical protein